MAEVFANPLAELADYTVMKQDMEKGKGPIQVSSVTDSQKVHFCGPLRNAFEQAGVLKFG